MLQEGVNVATEKVVLTPTRIDLHIHSAASTLTRDKNNKELAQCDSSEDALSILGEQLELHGVNMCAITDHDIFDLDLYQALKAREGKGSLKKVLPGVEFTVSYATGEDAKGQETRTTIHIVTIFDDRKPERLTALPGLLIGDDGKPRYDDHEKEGAFTEEAFRQILGKVGIGAVLIGHEKNAGRAEKNDVSSLGMELADRIVLTEFIDAMEIYNRNAEIRIREFVKNYQKPDVPFVLGSDCHNWVAYPFHDSGQDSFSNRRQDSFSNSRQDSFSNSRQDSFSNNRAFSSIKALPTFEGLVMAMTDTSRIKVGECSFFARNTSSINELDVSVGDTHYAVPMSPGINVIIGDNSIGKSLFLHMLRGYKELDPKRDKDLIAGYRGYCEREGLTVETTIPDSYISEFDGQTSVRNKLENLHEGIADGPFDKYYHKRVDVEIARRTMRNYLREGLDALDSKLAYNDAMANLNSLDAIDLTRPPSSKRITIGRKVRVPNLQGIDSLISDLNSEISNLKELVTRHESTVHKLGRSFTTEIEAAIAHIERAHELASAYRDEEFWHIARVNALNGAAAKERELLNDIKTDEDKDYDAYSSALEKASEKLADITRLRFRKMSREFTVPTFDSSFEDNRMGEFHFVSELNIKEFDEQYRAKLLERAFLKGRVSDIVSGIEGETSLTTSDLIECISNGTPSSSQWKTFVMNRLEEGIKEIRERPKITNEKIGLDSEPSAGLYGQIYFELIGQDDDETGIYIIDQPEDQISQRAIRKHVLPSFKRMAETRQVILVTHNPQFVVNLDADNVIALDREEKTGRIRIRSGALEYECEEYSILDVVANMVEGGADVVRKRLKRYGGQLRDAKDEKDS